MQKAGTTFVILNKGTAVKTYRVLATMSIDLEAYMTIKNSDDPWEAAKNLDGANFKELDGTDDWTVYDVQLEEKEN